MPTATREKCTVCPETSKKNSLESIGHFYSWAYKLGKARKRAKLSFQYKFLDLKIAWEE